ncbi:sigma-70 family RNA polymerase sigma factor [Methylomonas sp. BW4-1]|uniref:Sigma-70 family RNA polymerase sigma factor n=1 Tax=Methylomonas defluvii TaxID=3045149 RepID=A0ABU4UFN4_9GAMM|nr:sigma-70 family RNA polymerase sigma factor [Methylomonas sp. OY6]MDX8128273.1 sigma-70 family RNA polymerase sigma factor [Methylomonas sp. OY6]
MSAQPMTDISAFWTESLADELLRFLTGRLKCPDIAAELTHDTYLGLRQIAEKTPPDNARAMAFRIAINLTIDHQRKTMVRDRYGADEDIDALVDTLPGNAAPPEQVLIGQQRLAALQHALGELPQACRTVFLLHGVDGLTYTQIAERLGISKSQVNKLLAQAMAHCARQLAD